MVLSHHAAAVTFPAERARAGCRGLDCSRHWLLASPGAAVIAGIVLGFVNAVIRPLLIVLTLPFTLITLGLFIFIVNAIRPRVDSMGVPGFSIAGFTSALGGALVVSVVSWLVSALLPDSRN